MRKRIDGYIDQYKKIINAKDPGELKGVGVLPGAYFIGDEILALPGEDGDCRYPYGEDGFNYWTYASGYIHCNEGLFSPFLRASEGSEPKIAFFAGIKHTGYKFSCLSVPISNNEPDGIIRFTVFSKAATFYITDTDKLITVVRTFVVNRKMFFNLHVYNKCDEPVEVFTSAYFNPFLKNSLTENSTDRWFRKVAFDRKSNGGYFTIETYEEKDRGIMATNYGLVKTWVSDVNQVVSFTETTSRYEYVGGSRSSLHTPKAIMDERLSNDCHRTSFTETGICGDVITYKLENELAYQVEIDYTNDEDEFNKLLVSTLNDNEVEEKFSQLTRVDEADFKLEFTNSDLLSDQVMNPFIKHLMKQVEFCAEIKGFVQLSNFSLIGIRDVFQAIEGYLFYEPLKARDKILEALAFTSPNGRLPRQYSLPSSEGQRPAMDLRPFIDQGVWVISTILTYIRFTKDYSLLSEVCGYYDFIDEHKHIAEKSNLENTVLEHLIAIMDFLIINRDHDDTKCVLALYGDWNDALDGLGKSLDVNKEYGSGVSVMATLQVYQNLNEMIELIESIEVKHTNSTINFSKLIEQYGRVKKEIKNGLFDNAIDVDRIVHGWGDKKSYCVGSNNDPDGMARDGITSNAFWILSGLMKDDMNFDNHRKMILNAYQRLDSKYGLKTFEPYFEKGTYGVGRIPNLPKGTAENGATYIHASMFGAMSLFAIGEARMAWEELIKLLPMTHTKVSVSPFVVPNSYGYNEEFGIDGESMQDWQTGSSNVLFKTIIRYVIGFEPALKGLYIQPSRHQPFHKMKMSVNYLNKKLIIKYKLVATSENTTRSFYINSREAFGVYDPYMKMQRLFINDDLIRNIEEDVIEIYIKDC